MIEITLLIITHPIAMMAYGIFMHYIKRVIEEREKDEETTLASYWYKYPYKSLFSILGAFAGFGALYGTEELTKLTAFGIGYMSDSMAEILSAKAMKNIDNMDDKEDNQDKDEN